MQLFRATNQTAAGVAPSTRVIGNAFRFRLPQTTTGIQLLTAAPGDVRLAKVCLPAGLPSPFMDRLGVAVTGIELAAGQVLPLPPQLRGKVLEFDVFDQLLPNSAGVAGWFAAFGKPVSCCLAALEHPECLDCVTDPPDSLAHHADPAGNIGYDLGNLSADAMTCPVFVGDGQGKVVFHIRTTGGGAGASSGILYLETSMAPATALSWSALPWATTALAAAADLTPPAAGIYEATRAYGPYLRWRWAVGVAGTARTIIVQCHKARGRQL